MNNLPCEIFNNILVYLDRKDILSCLFVCKSWHLCANQIYWKEVAIHSNRTKDVKTNLYAKDHERYFKYGYLVRKIIIEPDSESFDLWKDGLISYMEEQDESFNIEEFTKLMTYFPNVEEIRIAGQYFYDYLYLLSNTELKCIQKVSNLSDAVDFSHPSYDLYIDLCFKYRKTITSLKFNYTPSVRSENNLHLLLNPFYNLTELIFHNNWDSNLTTLQVQNICPNLIEFTFQSNYPTPDDIVYKEMLNNHNNNNNQQLRILNLMLETLPINYCKYLISNLPNQLEKIQIYVRAVDLHNWINDIGEEIAIKLMERLSRIKYSKIWFSDDDFSEILPIINETRRMTNYFKLLNAFKGNNKKKETFCIFKIDDTVPLENSFQYNHCNDRLSISYGLDYIEDFFRDTNDGTIIGLDLPNTSISNIGFEIIQCMQFHYYNDEAIDIMMPLAFKYILENCPNLCNLEIVNENLPYSEIRADIGIEADSSSNSTTQNNLKVVRLINVIHHEEVLNLLNDYLPDIEVLSYGSSFFDNSLGSFHIDLTRFKKLKRICFDIRLVIEKDETCFIVLNFKYTDGDRRHYCYDITEESFIPLPTIDFTLVTSSTEIITVECGKNTRFTLLGGTLDATIAEFDNGKLKDLDYPIDTDRFYTESEYTIEL